MVAVSRRHDTTGQVEAECGEGGLGAAGYSRAGQGRGGHDRSQ